MEMASEVESVALQFQPPRKRAAEGKKETTNRKNKVPNKFGKNTKGIDVVVVRDQSDLNLGAVSPNTPTSQCSRAELSCRSADAVSETSNESYLTMTGTIRRGKKSVESIDVKLQLSQEELDRLEACIKAKSLPDDDDCFFGVNKGFHIFILSLFCLPFVVIISSGYSFYFGTVTWYNVLIYFNEEKPLAYKLLLSPLLILLFPFYIASASVGLGLYSASIQVSWYYDSWKIEIQDFEKGFYGWMCLQLGLVDCAPYEVIVLEKSEPRDVEELKKSESKSSAKISDTAL